MALFGIYVYYEHNARVAGWFLLMLPLTLIFDICWCSIWGALPATRITHTPPRRTAARSVRVHPMPQWLHAGPADLVAMGRD